METTARQLGQDVKVTYIPTQIKPQAGEEVQLHTVVCNCGNKVFAFRKQESAMKYADNHKFRDVGGCGSVLSYAGIQTFTGDPIPAEEPVTPDVETETQETTDETEVTQTGGIVIQLPTAQQVEPETEQPADIDLDKIIFPGRRGVTNAQMIPVLREYHNDIPVLEKLLQVHEKAFLSSIKYTPDNVKVILTAFVRQYIPDFKTPVGKKVQDKI